ncbi:MAG: MBL fold metallo-hydrolase [Myxococcota bacterium]
MGEPRNAAAVILLRPTRGTAPYEVYLTRRNPALSFMGGFHAFPGGSTDAVDETVTVKAAPIDGPFCSALFRETFEELGVLLARGADALDAARREELRRALLEDAGAWARIVEENDLTLDGGCLLPMGLWITPPYTPIRFKAHYCVAWLPDGQQPDIWPGELTEGLWLTANDALAGHRRGELFISYPVLETLEVLDAHGADLDAASAAMTARGDDPYPHAGGEMITGVHIVPLETFTLPPATHTNAYVLGGKEMVVVDPATPIAEEQERLCGYLDHLTGRGCRLQEIWLTHQHVDHIGAVEVVRERYRLPVAAHRLTARALDGLLVVDRLIEDNEVTELDTGAGWMSCWQALHTPGHAAGHLCFYEKRLGTLITGDNVLGLGTVMIAPPEGNMAQYMSSLRRLLDLKLGFIFPAHGPPVAAAREKIQEYIDHRNERETSILAALSRERTPRAVVPVVYTDVPEAVYPLAEVNVRAHLEKLVAEGRVRQLSGDRFVAAG